MRTPKSLLKKDGTFGKKFDEKWEIAQLNAETKKALNSGYSFNASQETEKAVKIEFSLNFYNIDKEKKAFFWVPKSIIEKNNGKIPGWFIDKKLQEVQDFYRNFGGYHIENAGFWLA